MWNRACRHIEVDFSLTGVRVTRVLEQSRQRGRRPNLIQVDNGPEFVSRALDAWAHEHGVKPQFIRPGKPVENAHIESFNGRLREECLNQHAFVSLDDVRRRIEAWRATTTRCVRIVRWGNWRRTNSGNCINRNQRSNICLSSLRTFSGAPMPSSGRNSSNPATTPPF
ncbi:integrase core domain-containing protein [Burkholderia sp. PR2]|uniref:integrase core domain-containing protein n=1 Tax=Burkholderia sp. PR2 TaxID=3448078 RepID=UPI00402B0107